LLTANDIDKIRDPVFLTYMIWFTFPLVSTEAQFKLVLFRVQTLSEYTTMLRIVMIMPEDSPFWLTVSTVTVVVISACSQITSAIMANLILYRRILMLCNSRKMTYMLRFN